MNESNVGLKINNWSRLGLGTGTLASLGRAASALEVEDLLAAMIDIGMTVIDTADSYASGDCEILLGKSIRNRRSSFTLVTKAGYRLSNLPGPLRPLNQFIKKGLHQIGKRQLFSPSYLKSSLDNSLSRMKTNYVDTFLLHDPPLEAVTDERIWHLCEDLKRTGKTLLVGVSSEDPATLRAAIDCGAFSVIQTPANLKVAASMKSLWDECVVRDIHVIGNHVYSPACVEIPGVTRETLMRASAALLPGDSTILCGTRNPSHLRQTNEWAGRPLPKGEALHLANEHAPAIRH